MRILYATDGSEGARVALDFLLSTPVRPVDEVRVLAVPVIRNAAMAFDGLSIGPLVESAFEAAEELAERTREHLRSRGACADCVVRAGPVTSAIVRESERFGAALIVVGSRGLGALGGVILGSTARWLAQHSPVPVLVVRERHRPPLRVLVVSEAEDTGRGVLLPRLATDARVTTLRIEGRAHEAQRILLRARETATDLIVLASPRMCAGDGLFGASVAGEVLSRARCAVLFATRGAVALAD